VSEEPPRPRPAHVITSAEVDAWLADSVVKMITYHRTSRADARAVVEHGVRIEHSRIGSYGQGFYTATLTDEFYGEAELAFALRLRSPLLAHADEVTGIVNRLARRFDPRDGFVTPPVAASIRREFLESGYGGVVAYDAGGDGIDYVVALRDESVRVVIDA